MVLHELTSDNQCPNGKIGPAARSKVQLRPLKCGKPVANQDGTSECETGRKGQANIPSGVVLAGIEIPIEATADAGLEEEEVMVGEKEDNWPAFEVSVEMGGWDEGQPCDCRCYNDNLLRNAGFLLGVFAEAVEAIECESDSNNPRPEEPRPAEIHPEEGV